MDGETRNGSFLGTPNRHLSQRHISSILAEAAEQLSTDEPKSFHEIVTALGGALNARVLRSVKFRCAVSRSDSGSTPSTREWVLGFTILTGNSPPVRLAGWDFTLTACDDALKLEDSDVQFADKRTEDVARRRFVRRIPPEVARAAARKLDILAAAVNLQDVRIAGHGRIGKVRGSTPPMFFLQVSGQWRIRFRWDRAGAYEVKIERR
jgi:proteic killer suppression protein